MRRRRDSWEDNRGPPPPRDVRDWRPDARGPPPRDRSPPRDGPPPGGRYVASPGRDAKPTDEAASWKLHTAEPSTEEPGELLKVAGCTMELPAKPQLSFWRALEAGNVERVQALLAGGEDVNQLGGAYGSTALGWAALSSDEPMLRMCLERGADANLKARKGSAPLHMAVWNADCPSIVTALLDAGAEATATNHDGKTPLQLARWFDELECGSAAPSVFEMDAWREKWGHPAPGRKRSIALLAAATGVDAEAAVEPAAGAQAAEKAEDVSSKRGRRERGADDEEEDEEETGGVRAISAEADDAPTDAAAVGDDAAAAPSDATE